MHCCISGCTNTYTKNKSNNVKFYYFSKNSTFMPWLSDKRNKWINAVKKHTKHPNDWLPSRNTTICSAHFIGNKKSENPLHPSYIPTIFPGEENNPQKLVKKLQRFERHQRRKQKAQFAEINTVKNSLEFSTKGNVQPENLAQRSIGCQSDDLSWGDQTYNTHLFCSLININGVCTAEIQTNIYAKVMKDFSCDPLDQHSQMLLCQGFHGITSIKTEENLV